jgi:hypothetical protein
MNPFFYNEEAGPKGLPPLSPAPPNPRRPAAPGLLRTISLNDSEHLLQNHRVSVASLRLLFTFAPERRSASLRNRCSLSPEYPADGSWIFGVLNSLQGNGNPSGPASFLYMDSAGNIYGTTYQDGGTESWLRIQADSPERQLAVHFASRLYRWQRWI